MGENLIAHLRTNLTIRIPRTAIAANLPATLIPSLQASALLIKGKAPNNRTYPLPDHRLGIGQAGQRFRSRAFQENPRSGTFEAMRRANDATVVITIRGIGEMTPRNPDSFIDLSTQESDFGRPKAVVHLGNAKASPQQFPGSAETNNDRATWDAMDAVADKIALIFAGNEPFEILANPTASFRYLRYPGAAAGYSRGVQDHRHRDDLGTTHHDAGTMRMGDNIADAVTNDFGRIHDTTNCYIASPALFPSLGSPNPMLTGVALGRRREICSMVAVLFSPDPVISPQDETGFRPLFDGTAATFKNWTLAGPGAVACFTSTARWLAMVTARYGCSTTPRKLLGISHCACSFASSIATNHNSGVFIRFPRPTLGLTAALQNRVSQQPSPEPSFDAANPAWKPVIAGFEVQIDDNARGDSARISMASSLSQMDYSKTDRRDL